MIQQSVGFSLLGIKCIHFTKNSPPFNTISYSSTEYQTMLILLHSPFLQDFDNGTFDENYGGFRFKSENYKTSIIYGAKIILCGKDTHAQLRTYINVIRPYIITKGGTLPEEPKKPKSETYVFTTKGNHQMMKQKDISAGLTSSFRKAGMEQNKITPDNTRLPCMCSPVLSYHASVIWKGKNTR